MSVRYLLLAALVFPAAAMAESGRIDLSVVDSSAPLSIYRDSILTQDDFAAFLQTIPPGERQAFLRSPERVERTLNNMMLGRRALDLAYAAGSLDAQPLAGRIRLEAGRVAVDQLRQEFLDTHMLEDYTDVARELFLTRREEFAAPATVDFAHVIIAPVINDDAVAGMRQILEIYDQAIAAGDLRDIAVEVGDSEDYRAGGFHEAIALNQIEPLLAQRLIDLQPGEISEPVRTSSGWHVLQMVAVRERDDRDFESVKDQAIERARSRHREELIVRFSNELLEGGIEIPDGAILELLTRHGVSWSREEG